jgi:UDP-N-acetylmuramoyl-L-alanyl-D-glutamate--2,6-diaminopimelate ligase
MTHKLSDLLKALPDAQLIRVTGDADITAPVVESDAELQPGGVFVARKGLSVDGHDFIPRAIEHGAAAIVGEREISDLPVPYAQVQNAQEAVGYLAAAYWDYPSRKMVVIGVTGTDGKTTTTTLIHSILRVATHGLAGMISTVAADLGWQTADTGLHVTTPGAPQIQALLAQMVANGLTHCVLEMTSHGLAQGRLNGVDLDVAVLTNVTHEHLDYHGSFEHYRAAKGRMFQMLSQTMRKPHVPKIAVINADDPSADYFAAFPADELMKYGLGETFRRSIFRDAFPKPDFTFDGIFVTTAIGYEPDSTSFSVPYRKIQKGDRDSIRSIQYQINLVGEFNVSNALAAVAATWMLHDVPAFMDGLKAVKAIPGRMERINEGQNFTAIVDFAHTPNALEKVLTAARKMLQPGKRLIAVFGSAGLRDREKRRIMAETSARLADVTILTAEDPRTESLEGILQVMADACVSQGGVEGQTFFRVPDRGEALYQACQMAHEGDIVIACGKGHEQSMCFGTIEYPWDDREAMRAALRGTPLRTLPTAK